jgi:hypothetical protein
MFRWSSFISLFAFGISPFSGCSRSSKYILTQLSIINPQFGPGNERIMMRTLSY